MDDRKRKCLFCTYKYTCRGEQIAAAFVGWKFLGRHFKRTKSVSAISSRPKKQQEVSCAPELALITSYLMKQLII